MIGEQTAGNTGGRVPRCAHESLCGGPLIGKEYDWRAFGEGGREGDGGKKRVFRGVVMVVMVVMEVMEVMVVMVVMEVMVVMDCAIAARVAGPCGGRPYYVSLRAAHDEGRVSWRETLRTRIARA